MAVAQGLASKEGTPNKAVLMASAFQYGSAPLMMLYQVCFTLPYKTLWNHKLRER
jgi:hypothetical protein